MDNNKIYEQFFKKQVPTKFIDKLILNSYIRKGQKRQKKVAKIVAKENIDIMQRIELATLSVMHKEPYIIFYKKHYLKEFADYLSIEECVNKVKQYLKENPIPKQIYD